MLAGETVAIAVFAETRFIVCGMLSGLDSDTKKLRAALLGGTAIGCGLMLSLGSAGFTVIGMLVLPAEFEMAIVRAPSAAAVEAVRLKSICVAVARRLETSSSGSAVLTRAPVSPVPMICTAFVSPRRIDAVELLVTAGGCAVPPVMT